MGLAQQMRGAHFMSHTLWTGWLCWTTGWLVDLAVTRLRSGREDRDGAGDSLLPSPPPTSATGLGAGPDLPPEPGSHPLDRAHLRLHVATGAVAAASSAAGGH